jgi:hypothetical protein
MRRRRAYGFDDGTDAGFFDGNGAYQRSSSGGPRIGAADQVSLHLLFNQRRREQSVSVGAVLVKSVLAFPR